MPTKQKKQTGGAVDLTDDESNIFNRIIKIYSKPMVFQEKVL